MKQILVKVKPYLRWVIFGITIFFLAKTIKDHAAEVGTISINSTAWTILIGGLIITLIAHIWAGYVWSLILREFNQPVKISWVVQIYLKTNVAKYLPGNIWHYYGRVWSMTSVGVSQSVATLSILLEPILMAANALLISLIGSQLLGTKLINIFPVLSVELRLIICILSLVTVLIILHPQSLNYLIQVLSNWKQKPEKSNDPSLPEKVAKIERFLWIPILGELGFLWCRGTGFLLTLLAFHSVTWGQIPLVYSDFSLAWLLGFVIPGAPGGVGVFEASAIALLEGNFSPTVLISTVAFYRLISILAETIGAASATLLLSQSPSPYKD